MLRFSSWWAQSGLVLVQTGACRAGLAAGRHGRQATARRIFALLAGQGHPPSLFHLGCLFEQGQGGPVDVVSAGLHYRRAALLGHAHAQYHLARLYAAGQGFMQDPLQAQYWFRQAARRRRATGALSSSPVCAENASCRI